MALNSDFDLPVAKRQKFDFESNSVPPTGSRLFAPFRTVGLVSPTPVPFTSVPLGTTTFQITTSVGRSLQTYDLRRGLNLVFISRPQCPATITATCAYRDRVLAAWGGGISDISRGVWVVKRGRVVAELEVQDTIEQEIKHLTVFGSWIVGCGPKSIEIWRNNTYEHYTTISPPPKNASSGLCDFAGVICTLPTFLNKILVGTQDGCAHIYNISTGKLVHTLQPPNPSVGAITALAPAPVVGLVAIAYANGTIVVTDIATDEILVQLRQSADSNSVTSITFRTDGAGAGEDGRQDGVMATSSLQSGDITFWDLNRGGKVVGVLRSAHEVSSSSQTSGINKIEFLPGQPLIVSSGLDNSLRSWIFDQTPFSTIPRPLHSRSGHAAPISQLRFLPAASDGSEAAGKWLLSAGYDRSLWGFSLRKDGQSSELSQGNVKHRTKKLGGFMNSLPGVEDLKAPPIVAMACSLNRDGGMGAVGGPIWTNPKASNAEEASMTGWESIVTGHEGDRFARTWFWGRKRAGRWAFETGDKQPVTCVAITMCGTFALVGSAGGSLDMFNLQSGIHRQRFPPRLTPNQARQLKLQPAQSTNQSQAQRGHNDSINGIVVDNLNQTVLSTGLDGTAVFWDFSSGNIIFKIYFESGSPTSIRYNSVSGLVSVACDDACIRVIDIETKKIVRELWGSVGQVYDHCFSHDGRWIVASSMDSVVRIFDLATGHLIDGFRTATCTNLTFSSTGEFLATVHAGSIGINIWNNKSLYTHIPTQQIDEDRGIIDLTRVAEFEAATQLATESLDEDLVDNIDQINDQSTAEQLDKALVTLSLTPAARWQTLLNIDAIRERNKPIQPPEKPKTAPFFLGSTLSIGVNNTELDSIANEMDISETEKSRVSRLTSLNPASSIMSRLLQAYAKETMAPEPIISHLKGLSPSAADLEIRSLELSEMTLFVHALTMQLQERRDFELVNTWMSVFLRIHAEFISGVDDIRTAILDFKDVMSKEEKRLSTLVGWNRGVVEFLRSAR